MDEQITIKLEHVEARAMLRALLSGIDDMVTAADAEGRPINHHLLRHQALLALEITDAINGRDLEQQSGGRDDG